MESIGRNIPAAWKAVSRMIEQKEDCLSVSAQTPVRQPIGRLGRRRRAHRGQIALSRRIDEIEKLGRHYRKPVEVLGDCQSLK